ncbi:MAG: hypothetical protein ABFC84_18885 [Veillonellales bacterium]
MTDENVKLILEKLDFIAADVSGLKTDVLELKMDVSGLKNDVSELKTDVSGLKSDVSELKTDVSGLKSDVSELKTDVSGLKTDVSGLKGDILGLKEDVVRLDGKIDHFVAEQQKDVVVLLNIMNTKLDKQSEILKILSTRSIEQEADIALLKKFKEKLKTECA